MPKKSVSEPMLVEANRSAPRAERVVCFSDVHLPYEDKAAVAAMLDFIRDEQPDRIVLNGDIADLAACSLHGDATSANQLVSELAAVNDFLDTLQALAPNARLHFNEGNHCQRYDRYIAKQAPNLVGMTSIPKELRLAERGITWLPYGEVYFIGHLGFTHGVYSGENFAKQHLVRYGTSLVTGHNHRVGVATMGVAGKNGSQTVRGCFGLGCLVPVDECSYMRGPTGWSQSFGYFYVEPDTGCFTPYIIMMNHQSFWWNGKKYGGK